MVKTVKATIYSDHYTVTDAGDSLIHHDMIFMDVNIHVEDHDIYYGNAGLVTAIAKAGSVITLIGRGNLKDIVVKNKTAGNTAKLSIVASIVG